MNRLCGSLGNDPPEVCQQPLAVLEGFLRFLGFVLEGHLQTFVDVAGHLEAFADNGGVELDLREDRRVGMEEHLGAAAAGRTGLLRWPKGISLLESLLPLGPVASDCGNELFRQRVDDAGADAVQTAGRLVTAVVELPTGVQDRKNHLKRTLLTGGMPINRNTPPIVLDGDRRTVLVKGHPDGRGMTIHRLVYRVVQDFPHKVVESGGADTANIHTWTPPNGLQTLENRDVFCGVRHQNRQIVPKRRRKYEGRVPGTSIAPQPLGIKRPRRVEQNLT
jgi:hypothetical protein